jgi:hypothetical protein
MKPRSSAYSLLWLGLNEGQAKFLFMEFSSDSERRNEGKGVKDQEGGSLRLSHLMRRSNLAKCGHEQKSRPDSLASTVPHALRVAEAELKVTGVGKQNLV